MWSFNIRYLLLLLVCFILNFNYICGQDVSASINTKKSLNIVDNRFISIVIDPLILMSGLNISSPTLNLAKHFSPALIRIQGFSTPQITYSDEPHNNKENFSRMKLTVTSSMWTSLNEWLISANLTPVFALSDRDRVNDAWNPKPAALPLMVMADKMNMTCFWELSNDTPNKSLKQYADDVTSLRHMMDAFPGSRGSWGIVGGELGQYPLAPLPAEGAEIARKLLKSIESTVDAVVWSPILNNKSQYPAKVQNAILPKAKKGPAIWTTAPRNANPSNFEDALIWAKNLGQSAARGYNVIFRQPKVKELFELTPAYWVSVFHKHFMGRNVLDIRSINYNNKNDAYIFAHCTKIQNKDTKKGGVTVFVVNMENESVNITAKFLGLNIKDLDVQSYVLTSQDENSMTIYMNGELLTISDLQNTQFEFMPKSQTISASKSLLLDVPPKSIGFFVIPNANVPTCVSNEHEHWNENIESKYEDVLEADSERKAQNIANMDVLAKVIESELLSNEEYIRNPAEYRRFLHNQIPENQNNRVFILNNRATEHNELSEDVKRVIIERAKQKKENEIEEKSKHIKQLLLERARNENTKEKLLGEIQKLKKTEVEQAIDELINNKIKENNLRDKRSLITSNEDLSWMQHEENFKALPRQSRRTQNNLDDRVLLDPIYENEEENVCACRRTGKCNCRKNIANMFLKQMIQRLNSNQDKIQNNLEYSEESTKKNKQEEIKEMKNLVNELKTIVTTMKFFDLKNNTNQNKEQEDELDNKGETTEDTANNIIQVNLIPKDRLKRKTPDNDVMKESANSVSKKRNLKVLRKKRAPLLIKDLKQLNNEILNANNTTQQEQQTKYSVKEELKSDKIKKKLAPINQDAENVEQNPDSNHQVSARYRLLQRKLMHQEKLENQVEHYLQKIRQSKVDLRNELEKSTINSKLIKKDIKREVLISDNEENRTNKILENNLLDSEEQTKETDILLNEISKEGRNLPKFIKEREEATYSLNVKPSPEKRINRIIKMFENESKQNNIETITSSSTMFPSTSSAASGNVKHEEDSTSKNEENGNDGFVDDAFRTISQYLSDFHRKIVTFLRFLSP